MLDDNFSITIEAFIIYLFLLLVFTYLLCFVENLKEKFVSFVSSLSVVLLNSDAFYHTNFFFHKYEFLVAKKIYFNYELERIHSEIQINRLNLADLSSRTLDLSEIFLELDKEAAFLGSVIESSGGILIIFLLLLKVSTGMRTELELEPIFIFLISKWFGFAVSLRIYNMPLTNHAGWLLQSNEAQKLAAELSLSSLKNEEKILSLSKELNNIELDPVLALVSEFVVYLGPESGFFPLI